MRTAERPSPDPADSGGTAPWTGLPAGPLLDSSMVCWPGPPDRAKGPGPRAATVARRSRTASACYVTGGSARARPIWRAACAAGSSTAVTCMPTTWARFTVCRTTSRPKESCSRLVPTAVCYAWQSWKVCAVDLWGPVVWKSAKRSLPAERKLTTTWILDKQIQLSTFV